MTDVLDVEKARAAELIERRQRVADIDAELVRIHNATPADEHERMALDERWEDLCAERDALMPELEKMEARAARLEEIKEHAVRSVRNFPEVKKPADDVFFRDVRDMHWREARDGALRIMEDREAVVDLSPHQLDVLDRIMRSESKTDLARRTIVTMNPAYRSAFGKLLTRGDGASVGLTDEERRAMLAYESYRAQDEATTHGGYALPVFIDPSVILTDQELDNPFLRISSIEDVNTNAWKGVSAAGVAWSFDAEAAEVSDDAITLAQPSVTVYTARGFIPYSVEVGQDWPGFQAEMARLLAFGYDDLLLSKFTNGNGTSEPMGVTTALTAQTTTECTVTTDGAFGQEDVYKVWKSLGQKYRRRASWLMSVGVMNKIRQFGASNVYHATTVTLVEGAVENLFNKPVYEDAYMPDFTGTTGAANILVVGDFGNGYKIARRQGMSVELVPHLIGNSNRPTGQRGWFAWARIGGNVVNNAAFQLLVNT
jgi:HK97 family phage major capsid protein